MSGVEGAPARVASGEQPAAGGSGEAPVVWLLDCTPARQAAGWFRAAVRRCGSRARLEVVEPEGRNPGRGPQPAALLISGSPRDAFADDEWTRAALGFVEAWVSRGAPVLGVCYGHQLLGRLAGARVARNPLGWEVGEAVVRGTGEVSPLGIGERLRVLESHQDVVLDAPAGCRVLAENEMAPVQAAEWAPGVYGVQFHPEFTGEILREVWRERREVWRGRAGFDLDAKLDCAGDCEEGLAVLGRFLREVGA